VRALAQGGLRGNELYAAVIADGKDPTPPDRVEVGAPPADAPWQGNRDAKVVVQLFSDFECPFCASADKALAQLMKTYGDRVKLVWRDLPLPMHPNAFLAHVAAREAFAQQGNDGFWAMAALLFGAQKDLGRAALEKHAEALGLDLARFRKALDQGRDGAHGAYLAAESKTADAAGVRNTPGFVVNGYYVAGAQAAGKLGKLLDRALAEAE
jgi:protein-disulfide isomerase